MPSDVSYYSRGWIGLYNNVALMIEISKIMGNQEFSDELDKHLELVDYYSINKHI